MLFYKAIFKLSKPIPKENLPGRHSEPNEIIRLGTEAYNEDIFKLGAVLLSSIEVTRLHVCLVQKATDKLDLEKLATDYIAQLGYEGSILSIAEITHKDFNAMVLRADRNDFIEDEEEYFKKNGLPGDRRRRLRIEERMLTRAYTQAKARQRAKELLCSESFLPEIERISAAASPSGFLGHPVHYMLISDSDEAAKSMRELLLGALLNANRLVGRRCCMVNLRPDEGIDEEELEDSYRALAGGTAIVRFNQSAGSGRYANALYEAIPILVRLMGKYRRDVLTVIECRPQDEKLSASLLEELQGITVVRLSEETVFRAEAKTYLKRKAGAKGVKSCSKLYAKLGEGEKGFIRSELDRVFEEWYDQYLRTDLYPQYRSMAAVHVERAKQARGSAIDELNAMTGLSEPKRIISEAIDFHKAQKLFADKGFLSKRPAMHMVFTGNPGTAKTTVARLFAQIMKDNGVLSVGKLIEVGRADLVGKYVGWTAQIVKDKFKAAKGSVLFIDEAYSLVEERGGLYGDEAINTIVQEMENAREDTVVIFAGYPDKMNEFVDRNPGLKSRIAFHVNFPDYSVEELMEIFANLLKNDGHEASEATFEKVCGILEAAAVCADFGNGRFVRTLIEKASIRQAARLMRMDINAVAEKEAITLLAEDFELPSTAGDIRRREIGF